MTKFQLNNLLQIQTNNLKTIKWMKNTLEINKFLSTDAGNIESSNICSKKRRKLFKGEASNKENEPEQPTEEIIKEVAPLKEIKRFIFDILKAAGCTPENAKVHADMMTFADNNGILTHGMNRLQMYCNFLKKGGIDGSAEPTIISETPACTHVDGNKSIGAVIGKFCMKLAIQKANTVGVGITVAKNCTHYGVCSYYNEMAVNKGLIGFNCSNTTALVVPTGAKTVAIGTNPIGLSAPSEGCDKFVFDFACSTVALGKLELYKRLKKKLPANWALDADGKQIDDPVEALKDPRLIPVGGHKGYSLGLGVEILTGILADAAYAPNVTAMTGGQQNLGTFYMVLNPDLFCNGFRERLSILSEAFRNLEPIDKNKPVLMPGDLERMHRQKVQQTGGIEYSDDQIEQCKKLAEEYKVQELKLIPSKRIENTPKDAKNTEKPDCCKK